MSVKYDRCPKLKLKYILYLRPVLLFPSILLQFFSYSDFTNSSLLSISQESRREGWTDARSAVGFCLGSGLFGSYNSD